MKIKIAYLAVGWKKNVPIINKWVRLVEVKETAQCYVYDGNRKLYKLSDTCDYAYGVDVNTIYAKESVSDDFLYARLFSNWVTGSYWTMKSAQHTVDNLPSKIERKEIHSARRSGHLVWIPYDETDLKRARKNVERWKIRYANIFEMYKTEYPQYPIDR